jgi:hypothetical protein
MSLAFQPTITITQKITTEKNKSWDNTISSKIRSETRCSEMTSISRSFNAILLNDQHFLEHPDLHASSCLLVANPGNTTIFCLLKSHTRDSVWLAFPGPSMTNSVMTSISCSLMVKSGMTTMSWSFNGTSPKWSVSPCHLSGTLWNDQYLLIYWKIQCLLFRLIFNLYMKLI